MKTIRASALALILVITGASTLRAQSVFPPSNGGGVGGSSGAYSTGSATYVGTEFLPPGGGLVASATEASVQGLVTIAGTISNFSVSIPAALGAGKSLIFTWRDNGADQLVTCTISGATATSCLDVTHNFPVVVNDLIDIKVVSSASQVVAGLVAQWGTPGVAGPAGAAGTNGTNGPGYKATSTTSLAITTGSVTFTTQSGLAYQVNDFVGASSAGAGPAFYMAGFVTSYSGTTLVTNVTNSGGSGTHADWNIALLGTFGTNGTNGNTILNGTGAPSNGLGNNGDYYLNNTPPPCLYGPKAAGAWPGTCVSLVGGAPYSTTTITSSPMSISAATHGQGKYAFGHCWDSPTNPQEQENCKWLRDPATGDLTLTYTTAPGQLDIFGALGNGGGGGGGGGAGTVTSIATTGPITGGVINVTGTIACPTCGVTGSPLSQFASTTSAQVASVVSDETGTGLLVFHTNATLVTPTIASFVNATHNHSNAAGGGTFNTVNSSTCTGTPSSSTFLRGDCSWAAPSGTGTVTVVGAGNLTNTALVTGGGSQTVQTPSATATLDSSGNLVLPGTASTTALSVTDAAHSASVALNGLTSGTVQLSVADVAGTAISYVLPSTNGAALQVLTDSGTTTCPTLAGGSPATCHLLQWVASTGTSSVVRSTSPTLVTPTIGVATATSINKMAITAPATSSTLAVADGKTFTVSNTMTLAGTDSSIYTLPGSSATIAQTIANGTSALGTGAIASGACATAVTTTATGTATTDAFTWVFNADPTAVTGYSPTANGMLTIIAYPTSNNVNFKVCNNTASSVTPGAITLNWRVAR